jgi:hypothetical protein
MLNERPVPRKRLITSVKCLEEKHCKHFLGTTQLSHETKMETSKDFKNEHLAILWKVWAWLKDRNK